MTYAQIIDILCIYAVNSREKMSKIAHFCGVKFLAWKSSSAKFWTNIMSVDTDVEVVAIEQSPGADPRRRSSYCVSSSDK